MPRACSRSRHFLALIDSRQIPCYGYRAECKEGEGMIQKTRFGIDNEWIAINSDELSATSSDYVLKAYEIDQETLEYALDKNERAHTEYHWSSGRFTIIYNVLKKTKEDNHYETIPMTFVVKENQLITIYNHDNAYIVDLMQRYLKKQTNAISILKFLFVALYIISDAYFPYLEQLDSHKDAINHQLRKKITKASLLALSDISTGMIYLVAATNQNTILLEQFKSQPIYKQLDEIEREQFEDSIIEAKQLSSMTQLNAQVLQQLYSTYDNILNNNLNDHMTALTIISIFLAISATVTGFFGMNVTLPIKDSPYAWLIIIGISLILCLIYALLLRFSIWKK